ncbi:MAG: N-6 DNA methylase [Rhodospirillales bacterium]|nr:N-6 DNA methylase [Rhodospirillales bacterium]
MASYARDALARIEAAGGPDTASLERVRETLEEALGIRFEGDKGEHFFRSTLVQTLFYGLFSAWVLWCRKNEDPQVRKGFDSQSAAWHLKLPVLRALFEEVNRPGALNPLRLGEVMEWAANTLCRVDDRTFFSQFREEQAVQYFYEPFLEAFDPTLRKALGVWYTPHEVVEYMVERVDRVLRSELGITDGLADPRVLILDPCCGTGSYLVEVLKRIERTLREKGDDALVPRDVKTAAMERVFGFELMPAPFVVAHLQVGLLMDRLGVPFNTEIVHTRDRLERAAIYLTNALTGWGEREETHYLPMPELHEEMDRARSVKRERPILVVLGNPPYNGFAGMAVSEERELSTAYRVVDRVRPPEGQGLNDLYVRFYRMAERRIVEQSGRGIVCYISNYSWLDGLSFTGMRERYLRVFDRIWIDCLNGDKYRTGKLTPQGEPDPSIFSTDTSREGIQVGTAIALLLRKVEHSEAASIRFRDLWGSKKRDDLVRFKEHDGIAPYCEVEPKLELGLAFIPASVASLYTTWPTLIEIFRVFFPGVKTSRDDFLVEFDRETLISRIGRYFDASLSYDTLAALFPSVTKATARYDPARTRGVLLARGMHPDGIQRYCYRPLDMRWVYWDPDTELLDRKREDFQAAVFQDNIFLEAREKSSKMAFDRGYVTGALADNFGSGLSSFFPLLLARPDRDSQEQFNLTDSSRGYLRKVQSDGRAMFMHAVACLRSAAYAEENASALRQDWPRIPFPNLRERLLVSAKLGQQVADLLDPDTPVAGVTTGAIRPELKLIGPIRTASGRGVNDDDLRITAGWGHAGQNGVTMPGRGRRGERPYSEEEVRALEAGVAALGMEMGRMRTCLGERTGDVWLNDVAYWVNVPERVWEFTIGGYQVMKKWLSYREYDLLGRPLKPEEAREVTGMARRLAALCLFQPALDENYRAVTEDLYSWPQAAQP